MNRILILATVGLLLVMAYSQITRETLQEQAALQTVLTAKCQLMWANPAQVRALPPEQSGMVHKFCPEI